MEITTAMLADAATVVDGKLYIQGGGITGIFASQVPATHPALALVLIFKLSWHEANEDLSFVIDLIDDDGQPVGLRGEGMLRVAPTPLAKKGSDLYQSTAQMFYGLRFDRYGTYRFRILRGDNELASLPLGCFPPAGQSAA